MNDLDKILNNEEIKKAIETFKDFANRHIEAVKKRKCMDAKPNTVKIENKYLGGE